MTKTKILTTGQGTWSFHADVPFLKVPKIKGSKVIQGVKYYIGFNGKMYLSSLFDKMFKRNY